MSKEMLDVLFGLSSDIVVYKNANFEYVFSNLDARFQDVMETSDILGKTAFDIFDKNIADNINNNDLYVISKMKPVKYKLEFKPDAIFEIISNPVIKDNKLIGIITIGRDVTFETKIKIQKDSFVATLTHDLKTPTIAQIRMIELLLSDAFGGMSATQKEMLKQILNSCKYMQGMISYILSTYKFENGKTKLKNESFNFKELVNECCHELNSLNIDKNLKFITKFNLENPVVEGDKTQLKRVIVNMISNAASYAFNNTEIKIMLEDNENEIMFYTINESPYMPSNVINHIFDKYVSGTPCTKFNKTGTGLGLYLSEQIISAHNGKMIAESFADNKNKIGFMIPKCFSKTPC